jgi:signal transduction histidine kinase
MIGKTIFTEKYGIKEAGFRDMFTLAVITFQAFILVEVLDLGKAMLQATSHQAWPIDKFITVPVVIALAVTLYAFDRLKERTIELQESQKIAEAANNAKSDFLTNMSHELRTPLQGILSFAGFGIKKHLTAGPDKILDYFHKIRQSGETLLMLVNDLLDLAKLESGKVTFEFRPADFGSLIDLTKKEYASLTSERNLTIQYEQPEANEKIVLDADKICQVLRNLFSNAVKFSPEGGTIDVTTFRKSDSIVVSVRDQGTGIPENDLGNVFKKFFQSNNTKNGSGGTGLGLAICQEIIAAHKGRIWAENNPDVGANLLFEIPLSLEAYRREEVLVGSAGD